MTRSTDPLVSILMPVYNAGAYLRPAVTSLLEQTFTDWELILVDDGSTDGCVETIASINDPRIIRIRQENRGKPAVLNRARSLARGRFWAVQDADDTSYPRRLELQVQCLQENPDVAGVFSGYDLLLEGRAVAPLFRAKSREECARNIRHGSMPSHDPTAMFRTEAVKGLPYSEDLPVVEGYDFIMRVGEKHPLLVLGHCLYSYRIIDTSLTRKDPARRNQLKLEVVRRMCARRGLDLATASRLEQEIEQSQDNGVVSHFTMSVADLVDAGRRRRAIRTGLQCLWRRPGVPSYVKPLLYALCPRFLMRAYRQARWRRLDRDLARLAARPLPPES